jgi:hypothetical protein
MNEKEHFVSVICSVVVCSEVLPGPQPREYGARTRCFGDCRHVHHQRLVSSQLRAAFIEREEKMREGLLRVTIYLGGGTFVFAVSASSQTVPVCPSGRRKF